MAKYQLPKTIYVKREYSEDDSYLVACDQVNDIAEENDEVDVGVYQLVKMAKVVNTSELVD